MAEQKLNSFRKIKRNNSSDGLIQRQNIPVTISKYFKVNYSYHIIKTLNNDYFLAIGFNY